jgi:polynucleotide 5'-hydroxyl-kinase GRC3/NOL9
MPLVAEMSRDVRIEIPPAWERITLSALSGTLLVFGAPDTGKSTFARYLYRRLCAHHERVAFVDGDVGQATLGPPTTMTLALGKPDDDSFPPAGPRFRTFVGDVSPRGHMLPTLVGAHKLVQKARQAGATAIVCDTTGLVDAAQGGGELKRAKVELLRPTVVVGIQRGSELEHLLVPLRRSRRTRVIDLPASRSARRREVPIRQEHRAARFGAYFEGARALEVVWQRLAVFPAPAFTSHRLVALEDSWGFTLGLGIVTGSDLTCGAVTLYTPLSSLEGVDGIRLGDLALDPRTFRETRL